MKPQPPSAVLEIADSSKVPGSRRGASAARSATSLLGHPHLDWDLATSATPPQVRSTLSVTGGRFRSASNSGRSGCSTVHGKMHEVTTFRRDVKTDGRHAEVEFGVSLDDDLARRDFTINAIAYSPRLERGPRSVSAGEQDIARQDRSRGG